MDSKFKPGDLVLWTSQVRGIEKRKTGTFIRIVGINEDAFAGLRIKANRRKGQQYNRVSVRALVEVPRGGKSILTDFYTPRLEVIKHASR
ncbi:hypothetical protein CEB3_c19110 [Peptococcaceae bacterium CEB3]|nr:hypothetical protein CEB3_c19110 [Peptococcaceae bacterium CEB3]